MVRKHKKQLIFASLLTLLPALVGLILREQLPELMGSRWGFDGSVPMLAVLFLQPILLLGLMWLCLYFTGRDPGNQNQNGKVFASFYWIIPILSNLVASLMFSIFLGAGGAVLKVFIVVFGAMFAVIGNFMPKTKRNSTIGVKVSWALASDENWNATHRFTGKLWFTFGILIMLSVCLPMKAAMLLFICLILFLAFAPMVYSYLYYKKQCRTGTAPVLKGTLKARYGKWGLAVCLAILTAAVAMMFVGNIDYRYEASRLTIEADFYSGMSIDYGDIDSIEYRETEDRGIRAMGWGSPRLLMGAFENEEFGTYTRYSYTSCDSCVVVKSGEKVLVLSGRNDAETKDIYEALSARIGG